MYVLFIVLNEVEYLTDILVKMKDLGLRGATVIDSMGSKKILNKQTHNMSFIYGIAKALEGEGRSNKTIFSVIERKEQVEKAMDAIEKILGGDMKKPNKGIMFVLPVTHLRGGELERHIESRERKNILKKEYESEYY
ncbi:MAG: hypothetical protein PWR27_1101 [Petroclostridium sp.]|uniref:hypothetical protein n=1 Tax=Petroclostridium xylanilyticum TaxID=1792311 RepID=UPI000B99629E|nr:hypothetical protein [Petroclostridium xylanilyticum]MBZ4646191.1 hypothetical protein [Clostridia bacterium]MDK2810392.1 hypothetical protein [Petroclostridium sp.]